MSERSYSGSDLDSVSGSHSGSYSGSGSYADSDASSSLGPPPSLMDETVVQRTLCGLRPTRDMVVLQVPNRNWEPEAAIFDEDGNMHFTILDVSNNMGTYECVFGDDEGRKLCYVRRRDFRAYWKDGFDIFTYHPNWEGQDPHEQEDPSCNELYPFAYLRISPLTGKYFYSLYAPDDELEPVMSASNSSIGAMVVFCTPWTRYQKFIVEFFMLAEDEPAVTVNQWKDVCVVEKGCDLLASLVVSYCIDRSQCNPLVTVIGKQDGDEESEGSSIYTMDPDNLDSDDDSRPPRRRRRGDDDSSYDSDYSDESGSRASGYSDSDDSSYYSQDPEQPPPKHNPGHDPAGLPAFSHALD